MALSRAEIVAGKYDKDFVAHVETYHGFLRMMKGMTTLSVVILVLMAITLL